MQKAQRLLDLAALLLRAAEPVSWREIQEQFPEDYAGTGEAAIRKFERDKAELLELGIPVRWAQGDEDLPAGYVLDRDEFYLPDLKLAPEDLALLYVSGSAALAQGAFPYAKDLAHAMNKLSFAGRAAGSFETLGSTAQALSSAAGGGDGGGEIASRLDALSTAVALKKRVHLLYGGAERAAATERDVDPYGLHQSHGAWFVVGHCHLRKALRTFHVGRILELSVNAAAPRTPASRRLRASASPTTPRASPGSSRCTRPCARRCGSTRRGARGARLVRPARGAEGRGGRGHGGARDDERRGARAARALAGAGRHRAAEGAPRAGARGARRARAEVRVSPRAAKPSAAAAKPPKAPKAPKAPKPAKAKAPPPKDARDRLRRVLFLVPYAVKNPGIPVKDLAKRCGVSEAELLEDLDFLLGVGCPPFAPDDFLDLYVEGDRVYVALHQSLTRPPRFTESEAAALAAAARALAGEGAERAVEALRESVPKDRRKSFDELAGRIYPARRRPRTRCSESCGAR